VLFLTCRNSNAVKKGEDGQNASSTHRAKFRGDRSNRCRDMAIFRHLGFSKCRYFRDGKAESVKMRHLPSFRVIAQTVDEIW